MSEGTTSGGRVFEVEIAGVPLRLKSSHDEQTVKDLVQFVDGKIRQALGASKTGSIQTAAILAALNLAEEFLNLKRKTKSELESLETRAQRVLTELESSRASQNSLTASKEVQQSGTEI